VALSTSLHIPMYIHSPNLKTLHGDAQELSNAITRASELAESVSSKVRMLDLAKASGIFLQ